jgi:signal transduction histidine kinase
MDAVPTDDPMDAAGRRIRRLKLVLLCAFGGMLLLMLGSGWEVVRLLGRLNAEHRQLQAAYTEKIRTAAAIRDAYRAYAAKARQQIAQASAQANDLSQFPAVVTQIVEVVESYPQPHTPDEDVVLQHIRVTLVRHRQALESAMESQPSQREAAIEKLLAADDNALLESTEGLQSLNAGALHRTDDDMGRQFEQLQGRSLMLLSVALASGLTIALGSLAYILKLQREAQARYLEISANRSELRKLSARLVEAQEQERKALSRELHDEIGQSLGSLLVDVGRLASQVPPSPDASGTLVGKVLVAKIKGEAERVIQSVRNMALLLRPSMLDDLGLIPALEWQAREVSRQGGAEVEVAADDISDDLPDAYRTCVYRVVQEALHNVSRHANARRVQIEVRQTAGVLRVSIKDDGRGFDPAHTRGVGLLGMDERVKDLGGTLTVESQPGAGTVVRAELPLPHAGR